MPNLLSADVHLIPQAFTTPLLDVKTDGRQIVWSTGAASPVHGSAPDLVRYTLVGAPAPLFTSPNRDSQLANIAISGSRYAFVEQNERAYGTAGWRIWYLARPSVEPIVIDSSDGRGGALSPVPFLAFAGNKLIWTAVHARAGVPRFELFSYDVDRKTSQLMLGANAAETEYWFPSSDGSPRVVYATVEHEGDLEAFHTYVMDTSRVPVTPRRLDRTGRATMPVIAGGTVIWKTADQNVFNWSGLERYELPDGQTVSLAFERQTGLNYPTVGSRFVAGWGMDDTDFEIFDLLANRSLVVERYAPTSPVGVVRPVIAGDLLTFIRTPGDEDPASSALQLCWMKLPDR